MTVLTVKPSHPALLTTGLATPPLTPISPRTPAPPIRPTAPVVSYAQLRAAHALSLRYAIAKLRWNQANNGYFKGEDAWFNHNRVVSILETELSNVEAAQQSLDRFPNCFAPVAFPKPHGPFRKEQLDDAAKAAAEKQKMLDQRLDAQFPFIKQLFIGPRTKQQARNDRMLRDWMDEGDFDNLSLLPSENMQLLMEGQAKKAAGGVAGANRKSYEQARMEKEKAKITTALEQEAAAVAATKKVTPAVAKYGPMTEEEWIATLPKYGPQTRGEVMLPTQREQRHVILSWLRKPWSVFDDDAAEMMEKLGRMALKKMDAEARAIKDAKARAKV